MLQLNMKYDRQDTGVSNEYFMSQLFFYPFNSHDGTILMNSFTYMQVF